MQAIIIIEETNDCNMEQLPPIVIMIKNIITPNKLYSKIRFIL